jgi:nucleotide-binding universal stress UspA family protein
MLISARAVPASPSLRRILLTADGSDVSEAAIPVAADLAAAFKSELFALRVIDSVPLLLSKAELGGFEGGAEDRISDLEETIRVQRGEANLDLTRVRAALEAAGGWLVRTEIRQGDPREEILAASEALACDAVMMGTHGRVGLRRALLGSTADHVVHHFSRGAVVLVRARGQA